MKTSLVTLLFSLSISLSASANESEFVKKIKEKDDDTYKVHCVDGLKGVVSIEEQAVCVFAKKPKKHTDLDYTAKSACRSQDEWTIEQAAEYLCKN